MKILVKKLLVSGLFSFIALLLLSQSAQAFIPPIKNILPNINFAQIWAIRCKTMEEHVDQRITSFDKNKEKDYDHYVTLKARITEKVANWKTAGYNVDKLKDDLNTLDDKIKSFASDYTKFIDKLKSMQGKVCDLNETDYKNNVSAARNDLMTVRKEAMDIRSYYWGTIRPDILDLKTQKITGSGE